MAAEPASGPMDQSQRRNALMVLVALAALSVGATTVYLPSLPGIARSLDADPSTVQLTITGYLMGMTAGQLIYGPLSDHFGRRIVVLAGMVMAAVASLFCAQVDSVDLLLVGRAVQAFGCAGGLVVTRAAIRDLFPEPKDAARANSSVVAAISLSPILAPLLGGWLDQTFGWRSGFIVIGTFSVALLLAALRWFPETHLVRTQRAFSPALVLAGYRGALRAEGFALLAVTNCAVFGMMYAFNTAAPMVMIEGLGITPFMFGLLTALFGFGLLAGSIISSRLGPRIGVAAMIQTAITVDALACLLLLVTVGLWGAGIWAVYGPVVLLAMGLGMGFPNIAAAAIATNPRAAGTTSAVVGGLQVAAGALGSALVALLPHAEALPAAMLMASFALIGLLFWTFGRRPPL